MTILQFPYGTPMPVERDVIDLHGPRPTPRYWTDRIIECVAEAFDVHPNVILGPDRVRQVAYARFSAIYLLRLYKQFSTVKLGKIFNRDHSTVIYALRRTSELIGSSHDFAERLRRAESAMKTEAMG